MIHSHFIRIRYGECDQMGFVHHSNYALYFEEARTEILRKKGISYKNMEDEGIIMPVLSMDIQFKRAAKYDDVIEIKVKMIGTPALKCSFEYEVVNQNNELLCTSQMTLFFARKSDLRPIRLPEKYLKIFLQ